MPIIDDFDEIRKQIANLKLDKLPKCPLAQSKLLANCLKEAARCSSTCKYYDQWTGPDKKQDDYCD